ncbi:polyphosphate kinase 2 [Caulobacter vibrioides]|uniref:polyphosphate kinase 2 n=1 Tax=Caulobacter vibrioides TaxID=155892 RepID=UPI000BB4C828|nr:polyphosphate kinase 2 [Caulobacter vibrioides]ATC26288.1 polyphosphate kinase 2 [Caulobacter vibrioides]AZH14424.1 polyphosphate kinase 2 [Caulobacter vibrioides]PLR10856.1 polyphosphate kinase 2 [Caulobacter vibrioides]
MSKSDDDEAELVQLQLALIALQKKAIKDGDKILVVFEGRDAAGKDGVIARITEHLSRRATTVVALPKPTDRERSEWYFQRYVEWLPACGEAVLFNRSWYNRAGVERVMDFSTPQQQEQFLRDVPAFERMLVENGLRYVKFWLDISREEQAKRLKSRREDPLKAFKTSPLDAVAQEKWDDYTKARDEMLMRTHSDVAPWICVRADHKKAARLNVIRWLLHAAGDKKILKGVERPDPAVIFPFEPAALEDGRLAR